MTRYGIKGEDVGDFREFEQIDSERRDVVTARD